MRLLPNLPNGRSRASNEMRCDRTDGRGHAQARMRRQAGFERFLKGCIANPHGPRGIIAAAGQLAPRATEVP